MPPILHLCCGSTIWPVAKWSAKMSVREMTAIEYQRAEPLIYLERSIRAILVRTGNTFTDLGASYEIMGYYACSSPHLSSAVLSSQAILETGDNYQKQSLLPAIASGRQIFALAITEPEYGWGPNMVQLKASRRNGNFLLDGTKLFIPDANVADRLLVAARTSSGPDPADGLTLFLVDKDAPGVSVRVQTGWIGPKVCEVNFVDVEVPAANVLGDVDRAGPGLASKRP